MPDSDVSNADRDLAVRTMMGEAQGQGDAGLAAVGHVIMNRAASGKYGGNNVADVVLAPNQFEPWTTRKQELLSYSPKDPKYQRAQAIFDQIVSGEMPDITDGSTHFLNAKVVRERGNYGGALPKWTAGGGQDIGDHTFYKPNGAVRRQPPTITATGGKAPDAAGASWDDVLGDAAKNAPTGTSVTLKPQGGATADDLWNEITKNAERNVPKAGAAPATADATKPVAPAGPVGTVGDAAGQAFINGIPVLGPAVMGGVDRAAAAIRSYRDGTPYADELAKVQAFGKATGDAYPVTSTAAGLAGGVASMMPVGATALGARALGITGENLLTRGVAGGLTGGLVGAADAGVRGENVGASGGMGAVLGGAGPAVGKVVGAGAGAVVNKLGEYLTPAAPGVSGPAGKLLSNMVAADGADAVRNRLMALGGHGMLAEAGPSLEGAAAGLIPKPGEAKSILTNAVRERAAGANARLNEDVRGAIGPAEDPVRVTAEILALRKAQDAKNYTSALTNAPDVDVSGLVQTIDGMLKTAEGGQKTALTTLRGRLVKGEAKAAVPGSPTGLLDASGQPIMGANTPASPMKLQTSAENLHNIKGELDAVINHGAPGLGVEQGAVARTQGALKKTRGELNAALEDQVPGYAEANKASAALAKRAEAVETGTGVLGSGKTTPTPEALSDTLNAMSPGERIALAKGTRGEIERLLGVKVNDLTALKQALQGEGGWNTAKLGAIFGTDETGRLVNAVAREATFADTTNKLLQNSQTANRLGGAKLIEDKVGGGIDLKGSTPTGLLLAGGKAALGKIGGVLTKTDNTRRDAEIARVLSARGPERDTLLNALTNRGASLEKTNRLAAFLAQRSDRGSNLLIQGTTPAYARSR
ncbi:cell wall hydrolase [Methylobacterium persicinum]|uniref:Cell wall hydrolase SleB domain-containing protein n=1 Tax=Methylobacterium persicinum TaxID=374426 RepID=A0ABU0HU24_9HYPH|nr:cell wall hydrolase [Methylobacterium persicinum]MDQ0445225.1 hypothetical protein [Methylobacterium persicinum]GJE37850.1 hypothetical protein KHHGKMAE_1912 [Methylobacterium persicinum]